MSMGQVPGVPVPGVPVPGVPVLVHATDPYAGLTRRPSFVAVSIDGGPRRALRWGTSRVLLPPGRHQLRFAFTIYQWRRGGARITLDTTGFPAPIQLYYAAPFSGFGTGTVGFTPDPGAAGTRATVSAVNKGLLVVLLVGLAVFGLVVLGLVLWILYRTARG